jgi:hypothetical protein
VQLDDIDALNNQLVVGPSTVPPVPPGSIVKMHRALASLALRAISSILTAFSARLLLVVRSASPLAFFFMAMFVSMMVLTTCDLDYSRNGFGQDA